jgi:hypothetical protein
VRVELLVGRRVVGTNGKAVGRIEELRAEERDHDAVVTAVCIGPDALLERLSLPVTRLFGSGGGYVARIDQIDLSDPHRPTLRVPVAELEPL